MSLSDPNAGGGQRPPNPAGKFFIQWQGKQAYWYYYDKDATNADPTKKGANIPIANMEHPLKFIVLDELNCIKGYDNKEKAFVYSNEVKNTKTEIMEVNKGGQVVAKGLYNDIKELAKAKKGDYTKSVYIAFRSPINGQLCIGNIVMSGAALSPFIDQTKSIDLTKNALVVKGFTNEKNGDVNFVAPVYSAEPLSPEALQAAIKLDEEILQPYLKAYFALAPTMNNTSQQVAQPIIQQPAVQTFQQQPTNNFGAGQQVQTFTPNPSISNQQPNGFGMNPIQQHVVNPIVQQQSWNPNGNNVIPAALQDNAVNTGVIPAQDDLPF